MTELTIVPPQIAAEWRSELVPILAQAQDSDAAEGATERLMDRIESGEAYLLTTPSAVGVVDFQDNGITELSAAVGAVVDDLAAIIQYVELLAQQHGSRLITLHGRRGWQRLLGRYGYTSTDGCITKRLDA